jgi:hypothetical protein
MKADVPAADVSRDEARESVPQLCPMLRGLKWAALAAVLSTAPAQGWAQTITFADVPLGQRPKTIEPMLSGNGQPGRWEVVEDKDTSSGKALAQLDTDPTSYRFPLAIYMPTVPADGEVTVRFKAISGKVDQAGGAVVRLQSPQNYYIARANALENNVRFYRVVGGRREQLASADRKVASGTYHTLMLRALGDRFTVSFNGEELFSVTDQTFRSPGKVAFWTKADSVTHFDSLEIKPLVH